MSQALTGAAIAAVIAVCWLLGQPRRRILRSTDTTAVATLNRVQMERLVAGAAATPFPAAGGGEEADADTRADGGHQAPIGTGPAAGGLRWPVEARERGLLRRQLERQFSAGGEGRRQAIALCALWRDRTTLPLIRRGLRDPDPVVMGLAAAAMAAFRGRATAARIPQPMARAPRNVSRTR
ncbi:MAG: hypothetical protein RLZZ124_582 [Cyanobacteriota bacterium]|jgi:hypothetical protein